MIATSTDSKVTFTHWLSKTAPVALKGEWVISVSFFQLSVHLVSTTSYVMFNCMVCFRYNGSHDSVQVLSTGSRMTVSFHSDSSATYRGFFASYYGETSNQTSEYKHHHTNNCKVPVTLVHVPSSYFIVKCILDIAMCGHLS